MFLKTVRGTIWMVHQNLHQWLLGQAVVVPFQNSPLSRYKQKMGDDWWNLGPLAYSSVLWDQRFRSRNWYAEMSKRKANRSEETCVAGMPGLSVHSASDFNHESFCQRSTSEAETPLV